MRDVYFHVGFNQLCLSRGFDGFRRLFVCLRSGAVLPCLVSAPVAFRIAMGYDSNIVAVQHDACYGSVPVLSDAFYIALCGADEIILTQFKRGFHNAV